MKHCTGLQDQCLIDLGSEIAPVHHIAMEEGRLAVFELAAEPVQEARAS